MKRLGIFVGFVAVIAGVVVGLRHAGTQPSAAVAALLPADTIAFAELPDLNKARDRWHESDIYQLYREPAVQDFLRKSLTNMPRSGSASETWQDLTKLDPKNAFVAATSIEHNAPKLIGGFRFAGKREDAEKILNGWRARALNRGANVSHQTVEYEHRQIEVTAQGTTQLTSVLDQDWIFVANDLNDLKAVLDRKDKRANPTGKGESGSLDADENFRAAMAHMPSNCALFFYAQPRRVAEQLQSFQSAVEPATSQQLAALRQIRSVCGTTAFQEGKMRDVWFIGMDKPADNRSLNRSSLQLATNDTFLYLAALLQVDRLAALNQSGGAVPTAPFLGWMRKTFDAAARRGVTPDDWKTAFDLELGALADWPAGGRWPALVLTLPVKDVTRAEKVVSAFTFAIDEDLPWHSSQKNGVHYFSGQWGFASFISLTPTIVFSDKLLVASLDPEVAEAIIARSRQSSSGLANSNGYKSAARSVPDPTSFFSYVDTALFYARLDAALRPMLLMIAAFVPGVSEHVDLNKIPPPEIVAKHLSPIVSSQRYERDGYVTESMGPITFNQAAALGAVPAILWFAGGGPFHP